jgi:outer membrane protein
MERILKGYPALPFILAILLLASAPVWAQTKVGLLNVERIMRDSPNAQQVQTRLREEFSPRTQEVSKAAAQIKTMQARLESNALTMSESERRTRERELNDANQALQRQQRALDEDINKRRDEEMRGIFDRITVAVKQISETEKFDIIFREVAWGNPRLDITDKVIKALGETRPAGQ